MKSMDVTDITKISVDLNDSENVTESRHKQFVRKEKNSGSDRNSSLLFCKDKLFI